MVRKSKTVQEQIEEQIEELIPELDAEEAVVTNTTADDHFTLVGEHVIISLRSDLAEDGYLVTGLLRGMMGSLDYSRINSMELLNDLERQAAQPGHGGEPQGLSDAQQIFVDSLTTQLYNIADVSKDLETFWSQVSDNPNLSIHPRTDAQILTSIQQSKARKDAERLAKLNRDKQAGNEHDRDDIASRRKAILARLNGKAA